MTKITVNLVSRAHAALEEVSATIGESRTRCINRAIRLYAFVRQVLDAGESLQVVKAGWHGRRGAGAVPLTMPPNQRRDLLPPPWPGWQDRAACARADPDLFDGLDRWQAAVGLCLDCPVRDDCLIAGLAKGDHLIIHAGARTWTPPLRTDHPKER